MRENSHLRAGLNVNRGQLAIAELLAKEGASVVATDFDQSAGAQVVADLTKQGHKAMFLTQDVTSETRWMEVASEIEHRYGRLNVLVSNAGIALDVSIVDMSLVDWRRQIAVNLDGVFLSVKYSLPLMRIRRGGGSIILMSSIAGLSGVKRLAGYCATKGGIRLFAKAVALECASEGIRVNSVHPGTIVTPIPKKLYGAVADPIELGKREPLGRAGQPMEVAQGVLYLASDASSYVTGTELAIDGGRCAGPYSRKTDARVAATGSSNATRDIELQSEGVSSGLGTADPCEHF